MVTDEELFAEATAASPVDQEEADATAKPEPAEQQEASAQENQDKPQDGRPRDEHGRFTSQGDKPKEDEQQQTAEVQKPEQKDHRVPLAELLNERERRQTFERQIEDERRQREALERRIAEFQRQQQPKPQVPDVFENPQGFVETIEQNFDRRFREQEANFSLKLAHRQYKEEFEAAYQALIREGHSNPAAVQSIISQPDPGEALVQWHRQRSLMEKVGGDLDGFMKRREEELLKDPEFRKRLGEIIKAEQAQSSSNQNQRPATVVQMPPSLSRASPASPSTASDDDGDMSDEALFRHATRR